MQFNQIPFPIPTKNFKVLRFTPGLAQYRKAIRPGSIENLLQINIFMLKMVMLMLTGMMSLNRLASIHGNSLHFQFRRLHLAFQHNFVA